MRGPQLPRLLPAKDSNTHVHTAEMAPTSSIPSESVTALYAQKGQPQSSADFDLSASYQSIFEDAALLSQVSTHRLCTQRDVLPGKQSLIAGGQTLLWCSILGRRCPS